MSCNGLGQGYCFRPPRFRTEQENGATSVKQHRKERTDARAKGWAKCCFGPLSRSPEVSQYVSIDDCHDVLPPSMAIDGHFVIVERGGQNAYDDRLTVSPVCFHDNVLLLQAVFPPCCRRKYVLGNRHTCSILL